MHQTLLYFWFQAFFKVAKIKSLSALRQKWWDSFSSHFISKINYFDLILFYFPDQAWEKIHLRRIIFHRLRCSGGEES